MLVCPGQRPAGPLKNSGPGPERAGLGRRRELPFTQLQLLFPSIFLLFLFLPTAPPLSKTGAETGISYTFFYSGDQVVNPSHK